MNFVIWLVIATTVIAVSTTIFFISKGDPNYRKSAKRNTKNLTFIYAITITLSFTVLAFYIWLF
ncbi:hypothetical protein F7731_19045 [Cytobacillus depressus]|uniref:Uncharacterized protein n=1 Tax=Cytobacillus depressus TaxID=1602942 RepID=A0A6L3V112_9BACI|nr:hypothetical protein [Cytobacillus depressus]KAB2331172.1 hypothetical protein F7731_19045 [Cytobacillus depressus]